MSEKTFITGKDAALEDSIEHMLGLLAGHGFDIEEVRWLNPVPHVWSVHIRDRNCPLCFTNGKGASRKAALASALGEYFERLASNYFFADFYLGEHAFGDFAHYPQEHWFAIEDERLPDGLLDEDLWRFYDPQGELVPEHLLDLNAADCERGICALPYRRQRDGKTVWFPVNLIGNLYVSNGMAAGNTPAEARTQALSEIFERWVKNRVIAEGLSLPDVPAEVLARYPNVMRAIGALEQEGFPILVKDASLGGRFPVMNVTLLNPENGGVFASFGAHPSFEVALERTLTELLQGRSLDQLAEFTPPSFDLDEVADPHNLETHFIDSSGLLAWNFFQSEADFPFCDWDFSGSTEAEFEHLCQLVHEQGHDVYIADHDHLGVYACRILVPGMSEIYPVDELVWNNNNRALSLRPAILHLPDLDAEECRELLGALAEFGLDEQESVPQLIGLAADPDGPWAGLRVAELRARLALGAGDSDAARDSLNWCLAFGQIPLPRLRLYRALLTLMDMGDAAARFRSTLQRLYPPVVREQAEAMLQGRALFADLFDDSGQPRGIKRHEQLLAAYARLQRAKRAKD